MSALDLNLCAAIRSSIASLEKTLIRENALNSLVDSVNNHIPTIKPEQMTDNSKLRDETKDLVDGFLAYLCTNFIGTNTPNGYPQIPFVYSASWNKVRFTKLKGLYVEEDRRGTVWSAKKLTLVEFARFVAVLSKASKLLYKNGYVTKRDFYYSEVKLFGSAGVCYKVLDTVSEILNIPVWRMHFLAGAKGYAAGSLSFKLNGEVVDFSNAIVDGYHISPLTFNATEWKSNAKFVLIVEKDAMFKRLLRDNILEKLGPMILVTGCGYPDFATRIFLNLLWREIQKPMFVITDCNPHGAVIMSVYKYGTKNQSSKYQNLTVPQIKWLGVHPTDLIKYKIKPQYLQTLTNDDKKAYRTFKDVCEKYKEDAWLTQIKQQIFNETKAEMECFDCIDHSFLVDKYIPQKVINKEWL